MFVRSFFLAVIVATALFAAACAVADPPFADPEDVAVNRQVIAAIGDYARTVNSTAVGGRVYLEGWVPNTAEKEEVIALVKAVPGVIQVMENLHLSEVGTLGGNDWD